MRSGEDLRVGDRLGRFQLVRELGRGSMGMVFLADDTMLRQPVCVKVLHASLADHPEASERFNREIVLGRRISHKGVCRLYDIYADGDLRYITMEFVEGESLRDLLQPDRPPLSPERVMSIGASICDALAAAHDMGVVHRDLKPRNIMVRPNDEACILDFGIATALDGVAALTIPGIALGTKHYIAPEVWAGRPATPLSDQFAVGVILYNCLTRRMPFSPSRELMLLDEMSKGPPPPPSAHRADVPRALDAVVLRALAFNPEARFTDARAVRDALLRASSGGAPTAELRRPGVGSASPDPVSGVLPPTLPSLHLPPALVTTDPSGAPVTNLDVTLVSLPPVPPMSPLPPAPSPPPASAARRGFVPSQPDGLPVSDASWVVSGQAVNLPAIPKRVHDDKPVVVRGIADMVEPDERPRPARHPGRVAALILVGAAVLAGAIIVLGTSTGSRAAANDAGQATSPAPDPAPTAEPTPSGVVPVAPVEPTPAPPLAAPDAGVAAPSADAGAAEEAEEAEETPAPRRPKATGERRRYAEAARALGGLLVSRGLRVGDDDELDRLRQRATQQAQQRDFDGALRTIDDATALATDLVIDRGFVERKLARFNGAFDRIDDEQRRAAADARVAKVMSALAEKRYQEANDVLNGAFELLR